MDSGGIYGVGRAGAPFDPFAFVQRPQVILRGVCMLFALLVFYCISSDGWMKLESEDKEVCIFNKDETACHYAEGVAILAFLASIGFLIGEYLIEQMSSVKTRKHYVLLDLGYSGFWAFLYFISFCYLANEWIDTDTVENPQLANGNAKASICFSFFSIFTWAGCAWFAYQRFRQGADVAFPATYETDPNTLGGAAYTSYPGPDSDTGYQEAPFSGNQPRGNIDYQAPAY